MTAQQLQWMQALSAIQEESVLSAIADHPDADKSALYAATADVILKLMSMLDGYELPEWKAEHLKHPPLELHDAAAAFVKQQ